MVKVSPSILSADFCRLHNEIMSIENADYLHFDVMDGLFVPSISFGMPVLECVRKDTEMTLDVHLMVVEPSRYAVAYAAAGADIVTFHVEADTPENITRTLTEVRAVGKRVGLAVKPATPAEAILPYIGDIDIIVVMTVEPGFGGQKFMDDMMPKLRELRAMVKAHNPSCEIEVDGGINPETARICVANGANVLVAGSDVFKREDRAARIAELRG